MVYAANGQKTLRPDLATFMQLELEMQMRGYVATRIMGAFQAVVASGLFKMIRLKSLLAQANADTKRGSKGNFNQGDYEYVEADFRTLEYGWEEPIDKNEAKMYANFLDAEEVATMRAWEHVLSGLESRVLDKAVTAVIAANQKANATAAWTSHASAVPMTDVKTARRAVWLRTGRRPNTVAMAYEDFDDCRRCAQVVDAIAAQGAGDRVKPGDINAAMLAQVFDVEQVVVADSIKNTANIGQNATVASLWPEGKVWVGVTTNSKDFKTPCFGRVFHYGGDQAESGAIGTVDQYDWEPTDSLITRVRNQTDEKILYQEMAQVIEAVRG